MKKLFQIFALVAVAFAQMAHAGSYDKYYSSNDGDSARSAVDNDAAHPIGERAYSAIVDNNGDEIGEAHYIQGNKGVIIDISVSEIPPGKHGLHFHEVGTCEDPENFFKMSKGHIMPTNKPHGFLHPDGPHEGNLPNLTASYAGGGVVDVELYTEMVSVSGRGGKPALLDANGSALIIHVNEDDHKTQPIGGAGARIGCGKVEEW